MSSTGSHRHDRDFSQMSNAYTSVHVPEDSSPNDCWDPFAYDRDGNQISPEQQQLLLEEYRDRRHPHQHRDNVMNK